MGLDFDLGLYYKIVENIIPSQGGKNERFYYLSNLWKKIYCRKNFSLNKKNNNQSGKENHFYGKTHTKEAKERIGQASSKWLKEAYKEGRKTSPFKHLGRHNEPSQFEKAIIKVLLPFGFIFDYEVPFNKGSYMIDFALLDKMIAIEVDSKLHDKTRIRDIKKDRFLRNRGWKVYRFRFNAQKNPQIVAQEILIKTKEVLSNEN